jgi:hypothetical protein
MPEKANAARAENRHGGAPRGGVPVARDAPRLASVASRLTSATPNDFASRRSAHPSVRGRAPRGSKNPDAETRLGTNKTALFDIVKCDQASGSSRARARFTPQARSRRRQRRRASRARRRVRAFRPPVDCYSLLFARALGRSGRAFRRLGCRGLVFSLLFTMAPVARQGPWARRRGRVAVISCPCRSGARAAVASLPSGA